MHNILFLKIKYVKCILKYHLKYQDLNVFRMLNVFKMREFVMLMKIISHLGIINITLSKIIFKRCLTKLIFKI
jgi:hypothetical protein